jgi:hypothetical protein
VVIRVICRCCRNQGREKAWAVRFPRRDPAIAGAAEGGVDVGSLVGGIGGGGASHKSRANLLAGLRKQFVDPLAHGTTADEEEASRIGNCAGNRAIRARRTLH